MSYNTTLGNVSGDYPLTSGGYYDQWGQWQSGNYGGWYPVPYYYPAPVIYPAPSPVIVIGRIDLPEATKEDIDELKKEIKKLRKELNANRKANT